MEEEERPFNPFQSDVLAKAIKDPSRVRDLLAAGQPVTVPSLLAANDSADLDSLKLLLSALDPNARLSGIDPVFSYVPEDWVTRGESSPEFRITGKFVRAGSFTHDWYPIQYVAHAQIRKGGKEYISNLMAALLRRGADPYALSHQPLRSHLPCYFPGESLEQGQDDSDNEWNGFDPEDLRIKFSPRPLAYGVRSIVHALLEDGALCEPFLSDDGEFHLDTQHRDPQGRTPLLSACRSIIGADAAFDAVLDDMYSSSRRRPDYEDPFESTKPSLFQAIMAKGADVLSVDIRGKNVLHHLLEANRYSNNDFPPRVRRSVKYVAENFPALISQPDRQGMLPLCSALQRLRRYPSCTNDIRAAELEATVNDLLDAGADPLVRDTHGNTGLHYLAATRLADWYEVEPQRLLFQRFISLGVDVNARNDIGKSALELLLEDEDASYERFYDYPSSDPTAIITQEAYEEADMRLWKQFDDAGVKWTERNSDGQTLLHFVAKSMSDRGPSRARFLLEKGVDPKAKDKQDNTAADLALAYGQLHIDRLMAVLESGPSR